MALPIYEFIINPEDKEMGMKAISLVDRPAMESEFIAFNKSEKKKVLFKIDDKKYIVAGLALIPDKLVYRVDEETGEEYFGFFSAETIEIVMDKFMKEATEGTTTDVNFQHNSEDKTQAHLVESFILRTPEMVSAVQKMGIEDAVLGAWFVSYKFDNFDAYDKATEGSFTGFSIEIMLQRELKLNKNNNKVNNNIMAKFKKFVDKFKTILDELENAEVLEDAVVPETGKSLRIGEVGAPVQWVSTDEAGEEVLEPVAEGEYIVEDGRTIVVDAQGNLVEIKDASEPVTPLPEEELAKYPWDKCIADRLKDGYSQSAAEKICGKIKSENASAEDVEAAILSLIKAGDVDLEAEYLKCNPRKKKLEDGSFADMPEDMPPAPADSGSTEQPDVTSKTLGELIDVTKDGEYYIAVSVQGGKIVEATVEAEQALVKAQDFNALKTENETLKAELAKPVTKSIMHEFTEVKENKVDTSKMNNLELTMHKLGLNK